MDWGKYPSFVASWNNRVEHKVPDFLSTVWDIPMPRDEKEETGFNRDWLWIEEDK